MTAENPSNLNRHVLIKTAQQDIRKHVNLLQEGLFSLRSGQKITPLLGKTLKSIQVLINIIKIINLEPFLKLLKSLESYFKSLEKDTTVGEPQIQVLLAIMNELSQLTDLKEEKLDEYVQSHLSTYVQLISQLKKFEGQLKGKETQSEPPLQLKQMLLEKIPEKITPSLFTLFLKELRLQTLSLDKAISALEMDLHSQSDLENLIRIAQSIEQAGCVVKLSFITKIGEVLEKCFKAIEEGAGWDQEGFEILFEIVNFLSRMSTTPVNQLDVFIQDTRNRFENLTQQLEDHLSQNEQKQKPFNAQGEIASERQIYQVDPTMFDLFRIELENQTVILNNGLVEWEQSPTDMALLESLMRAAHSIKGAARVVALAPIVKIAHAMEDCLVAAQNREIELDVNKIDRLLQGVDLLSRLSTINFQELNTWFQEHHSLIESLVNEILPFSTQHKTVSSAQKVLKVKGSGSSAAQIAKVVQNEIRMLAKRPETRKAFQTAFVHDRVLRVTAQNLNRLMGLAGESLVESRWLYPFGESLQKLKQEHNELSSNLDVLRESIKAEYLNPVAQQCLLELQHQINNCRYQLTERLGELDNFIRRHASLSDRLYQEVINSRMRPFSDGVEAFPRMVRDLARQLGKKVKLKIEGKSTPVDRDILERLESPLSHLLRNAVDHGIESPQEREALGKFPEGLIKLEAHHHGGMLVITVSDDGRGIDLNQFRRELVERNLISAEGAEQLSDTEILDFLFLPGFSTATQVTEISGRGIGLNIVQSVVQELGGIVRTFLHPEKGITFHLELPLTLSVIRALLVEISGEPYAFPLARIDQAFLINLDQVDMIENRQFFHYEGKNIGLILAWQVLELDEPNISLKMLPVIMISNAADVYGLVVDRLIGEKELVVQELDIRLGKVSDISAGALMEDGKPVLIIDVEDVIRSIDQLLSRGHLTQLSYRKEEEQQQVPKRILVVDDSLTVREVECRLLQNQGYKVEIAVNGLEAWNAVRIGHYDLVITDIDMPHMNGIELVRAIKSDQSLKSLPIMIISYKEGEEDKIQGLEAGADYYLTKSNFYDFTLLEAVKNLIGKPELDVKEKDRES